MVLASSFWPLRQSSFWRTSGSNSIFSASKSFLMVSALLAVEGGQSVEGGSDLRMRFAQGLLTDAQAALIQRFRLLVLPPCSRQVCQPSKRVCHQRVIRSQGLFPDTEGPLIQG